MDSDVRSTADSEPSIDEKEPRSVQEIEQKKSLRWTLVAYLLVLLGAVLIFEIMSPGNVTPRLDQTWRTYVLVGYGIGATFAAALVRLLWKTNNHFAYAIPMLLGGLGCGTVVFIFFATLISLGI